MKPSLARPFISFGRVKASARKITSGWRSCTSRISHSQNGNGLVCGLSTRKMLTPWSIQNSTTSRSAFHSAPASSRREIRIDDVLVFLRRIFRIAHRAVGPALEPVRDAASARDGRASTARRNRARLPCRAICRPRRTRGNPPACRARDGRRRGRLRRRRWRRGCRDRRRCAVSALLRPLRLVSPIGWIGVK